MANWFSQRGFNRTTISEALQQGLSLDMELFRPGDERLCFASEGQESVASAITCLFCISCPPAVSWLVVSVIVNPLNRVATRRTFTHVSKKRRERLSPGLADCDSTPTIAWIGRIVHIETPSQHHRPRPVLRRSVSTVSCETPDSRFVIEAAAASSIAACQNAYRCRVELSTITPTEPLCSAGGIAPSIPKYQQSAKTLPRQVLEIVAVSDRIRISHDRTPVTRLVRTAGRVTPTGCSYYIIAA